MTYQEQINHPKWQKKRLEVLKFYKWACKVCGNKEEQLHVHHPVYKKGAMIWQYKKEELEVLCRTHHKAAHNTTATPSISSDGIRAVAVIRTPCNKDFVAVRVIGFFETPKGKFNPGRLLNIPRERLSELDGLVEQVESIEKAELEDYNRELEYECRHYPELLPDSNDTPDQAANKFFARMKLCLGEQK